MGYVRKVEIQRQSLSNLVVVERVQYITQHEFSRPSSWSLPAVVLPGSHVGVMR